MRRAWLIAAGAIFVLGTAAFFWPQTKYVQTDCHVDPANGAAIWMRAAGTANNPHQFNIEFQPAGIVMRFPPQFYGLVWEDFADIELANRQGSTGLLKLHMKFKSGESTIDVGTIQQACWISVQKYLREMHRAPFRLNLH